ncbi:MAG TPA: SigE family RNA polymerase sigma factor [Streptosporangiaceae bacterium]
MQPSDVDSLELFLAERGRPLLRTAKLLTGSQEAAEDLLQAALERLLKHWKKIDGDPEGYLRRTLYNLAADGWRRRTTSIAALRRLRAGQAGGAGSPAATELVDLRDALVRLMLRLPARQRTVLVLRYWEGMTEAEIAEQLGCPIGTVKSAASRGMARLRDLHVTEHFVQTRS